jgi:CRP-like cAMP-binding protein
MPVARDILTRVIVMRSHSTRRASLTRIVPSVPKPVIRAVPFGDTQAQELTLSGPDREALRSIATFQRLPARTVLFEQSRPATHIYNVLAGCLYADRHLPSGVRRGMALLLPGDLSGLASRGRYVNTARTLTDCDLLKMPLDQLKTVLLRNASLQMFFLCKAAHAIRESQWHVLLLSHKDPVERVALLIAALSKAAPQQATAAMGLPLTHQELAGYLDLPAGQVARAIESLERSGAIRQGRGGVRVIDSRRLHRQAQSSVSADGEKTQT